MKLEAIATGFERIKYTTFIVKLSSCLHRKTRKGVTKSFRSCWGIWAILQSIEKSSV
jgi:hypothetical protein